MAGEVEETIQQVNEAITELRKEVDKKSADPEKIEKLQSALDVFEEKNQEQVAKQLATEKESLDQKERIDQLELEVARSSKSTGLNYQDSDTHKALLSYVKNSELRMTSEEVKVLRTDNDVSGGYLVTSEMDSMVTKDITEISNIRSVARVRSIGSKTLEMPIRKTIPLAMFEGEAEEGGEDNATYGSESITAFRQTVTVPITKDMLMDAAFNMEGEIFSDAAEGFAQGEGAAFVNGTGFKQPEGFLSEASLVANARITTTSATIDADDVILLTGDLKAGYNPVYVMNRRTLAFLRTLKSSTGMFLWQPGMNGPVANTINGDPYILANDMPDIASGSLSIAYGDFRRGYTIIDRMGMSIIRDEVTQKKKAIVEFTLNRWLTGQVTLPEAIKLLQTKA